MKLLRYGKLGKEKPGILDKDGRIRDLSAHMGDIEGATISPKALAKYLKSFAGRVFEITFTGKDRQQVNCNVTVERASNRDESGYGWHLTRKAVAAALDAPTVRPATVPAPIQPSAEVVQLNRRGQRGMRSPGAQSGDTPNALLIAAAAKAG